MSIIIKTYSDLDQVMRNKWALEFEFLWKGKKIYTFSYKKEVLWYRVKSKDLHNFDTRIKTKKEVSEFLKKKMKVFWFKESIFLDLENEDLNQDFMPESFISWEYKVSSKQKKEILKVLSDSKGITSDRIQEKIIWNIKYVLRYLKWYNMSWYSLWIYQENILLREYFWKSLSGLSLHFNWKSKDSFEDKDDRKEILNFLENEIVWITRTWIEIKDIHWKRFILNYYSSRNTMFKYTFRVLEKWEDLDYRYWKYSDKNYKGYKILNEYLGVNLWDIIWYFKVI